MDTRGRSKTAGTSLEAWLRSLGLLQYLDEFERQGYDDLTFLLALSDEQVHVLCSEVGLAPGHAIKVKVGTPHVKRNA